jgi:hypothetical protein
MSSVFDSKHLCEQLFSLMKNVKSRTRTRLTEEYLEGCMRIATSEIEYDIERLLKQKQCQIFHSWLALLTKIIE